MNRISTEVQAQRGREVVDAALAEAGWPNAVCTTTGKLLDMSVPVPVLYKAWALGMQAAGENDLTPFERWPTETLAFFADQPLQQALWSTYFARHGLLG